MTKRLPSWRNKQLSRACCLALMSTVIIMIYAFGDWKLYDQIFGMPRLPGTSNIPEK